MVGVVGLEEGIRFGVVGEDEVVVVLEDNRSSGPYGFLDAEMEMASAHAAVMLDCSALASLAWTVAR